MSRHRDRKGLQVARGERYALIPREVLESEAYKALPSAAVRVLLALAVQFYGSRNGSLALPFAEAHGLGVSTQAQLYGSLQLLQATQLITSTRRGNLVGGRKLPSLYALTWKPINEPASGVIYDGTITFTLKPSHAWATWKQPQNWNEQVRIITRRAKGRVGQPPAYPAKSNTPRGERTAHHVGRRESRSRSPRGETKMAFTAHPVGVTSKISGRDTASDAWDLAFRLRDPALQLTAVAWLLIALMPRSP